MPLPGSPRNSQANSRLVYSTDGTAGGRVAAPKPPARRPQTGRPSQPAQNSVPNDGIVRIQRDKRGRGGKTATVITGLPGTEADLDTLLKTLKQECGAGGQRDGRSLEIQGDHRDRLLARITALG